MLSNDRNNAKKLKQFEKGLEKKRLVEERDWQVEQDELDEFYKNYNPLLNVVGEAGNLAEMPATEWGPGRFGKESIHPKDYEKALKTPLTKEEQEWVDQKTREDEEESDPGLQL